MRTTQSATSVATTAANHATTTVELPPTALSVTGSRQSTFVVTGMAPPIVAAKLAQAIGQNGKVDEAALRAVIGGEGPIGYPTSLGWRYVDIVEKITRTAIETKTGYTALTPAIELQIAKDAELLKTDIFGSIVWMFQRSSITGLVGPSKPLQKALLREGFSIVEEVPK